MAIERGDLPETGMYWRLHTAPSVEVKGEGIRWYWNDNGGWKLMTEVNMTRYEEAFTQGLALFKWEWQNCTYHTDLVEFMQYNLSQRVARSVMRVKGAPTLKRDAQKQDDGTPPQKDAKFRKMEGTMRAP